LPGTLDYTHGFWRRCIVVPFNRTFRESEMVRDLDKEIIANEQAGVAAWAVKGAMRLLANKEYTVPPSSLAVLGDWVSASDVVHDFVESCCARGGKTQARDLYALFRQWLAENGHRQMSSTTFGRRLRNLKVPNHKAHGGVVVYELSCNYSPTTFVSF
jgi:putative DNA primase/helicase